MNNCNNIPLLIFDLLILPFTIIRIILIYFFGSKYNIESLSFLDIMMHADNKYFNQEELIPTINTIKDDIRVRINYDSRYNKDIVVLTKSQLDNNNSKHENAKIEEQNNNDNDKNNIIDNININNVNLDKNELYDIIKSKLDFVQNDIFLKKDKLDNADNTEISYLESENDEENEIENEVIEEGNKDIMEENDEMNDNMNLTETEYNKEKLLKYISEIKNISDNNDQQISEINDNEIIKYIDQEANELSELFS